METLVRSEIPKLITPTRGRALLEALGSAAITFVAMEAGALIGQFISGETLHSDNMVHIFSGMGALISAGKTALMTTRTSHEQTPLSRRLIRTVGAGAFTGGLTLGLIIGLDNLLGRNLTPANIAMSTGFSTSLGLISGWTNGITRIPLMFHHPT